jgi:hypothetical protein
LPFCRDCGAKLKENARFCAKCGTPIDDKQVKPIRRQTEEKACFGPPGSGGGLWGAISFGIFVIGVGILWYLDFFWPGILFLIALMIIIGAVVTYSKK